MASTDARPVPKKNTAYRVTFPIFDADGDLVTAAAGLDSEISGDGGTFADATNEATEIATSSGMYYLDLTAGEMNYDCVSIIVKTSTTGAKTTPIVLYPEEAGDIRVDVTMVSGDATAADNAELMFDGTGYAGGTTKLDVNTTTIANNAITAASIATDADAEIADAVLDEVFEGAVTLRQALRLLYSVLGNKSAGGGTTTVTFRDIADTKNRVSATVDADGNRTAVTLDVT
jgi:hypothetical protein